MNSVGGKVKGVQGGYRERCKEMFLKGIGSAGCHARLVKDHKGFSPERNFEAEFSKLPTKKK